MSQSRDRYQAVSAELAALPPNELREYTQAVAAPNPVQRITVSVELDLDLAAYELDYGRNEPAEAKSFTAEIVRDAANERFKLLGWATVVTEPPAEDQLTTMANLLNDAEMAADGDSNDGELSALRDALDYALGRWPDLPES